MNELVQIRKFSGVTLAIPKYIVKGKFYCLVQTSFASNLYYRNGKHSFKRVMHRTLWNSLQQLFLLLLLIFSRASIPLIPGGAWKKVQAFPMLLPPGRPSAQVRRWKIFSPNVQKGYASLTNLTATASSGCIQPAPQVDWLLNVFDERK